MPAPNSFPATPRATSPTAGGSTAAAVRFAIGFDTDPLLKSFEDGTSNILKMMGLFQEVLKEGSEGISEQLRRPIQESLKNVAAILHDRGLETLGVLDTLVGREEFMKQRAKQLGKDLTLLSKEEVNELYGAAKDQQEKLTEAMQRHIRAASSFADEMQRASAAQRVFQDDTPGLSPAGPSRGMMPKSITGEETIFDKIYSAIKELPDKLVRLYPFAAMYAADKDVYSARRLTSEAGMTEQQIRTLVGTVSRQIQAEGHFVQDNDFLQGFVKQLAIQTDLKKESDIVTAGKIGTMLNTILGQTGPEAVSTLATVDRNLDMTISKTVNLVSSSQVLAQNTSKSVNEMMKVLLETSDYVRRLSREDRLEAMQEVAATVAAFDQAGQKMDASTISARMERMSKGGWGSQDETVANLKLAHFLQGVDPSMSFEKLSGLARTGKASEISDLTVQATGQALQGLDSKDNAYWQKLYELKSLTGLTQEELEKNNEVFKRRTMGNARGEFPQSAEQIMQDVLATKEQAPTNIVENTLQESKERLTHQADALFRDMGSSIAKLTGGPMKKFADLSNAIAASWLKVPEGTRDIGNVLTGGLMTYGGLKGIQGALGWLKHLANGEALGKLASIFKRGAAPVTEGAVVKKVGELLTPGAVSSSLLDKLVSFFKVAPKGVSWVTSEVTSATAAAEASVPVWTKLGAVASSAFSWSKILRGTAWGLLFQVAIDGAKGWIDVLGGIDGVTKRWTRFKNVVTGLGASAWTSLKETFSDVVKWFSTKIDVLRTTFTGFFSWMKTELMKNPIVKFLVDTVGPILNKLGGWVGEGIDVVKDTAKGAWKTTTDIYGMASHALPAMYVSTFDKAMDQLGKYEKMGADINGTQKVQATPVVPDVPMSRAIPASNNLESSVVPGVPASNNLDSLPAQGGQWWSMLQQHSRVDPALALALMQRESGGDPNAKNPDSSATGLFQLLKGTGQGLGLRTEADFRDPIKNTRAGTTYLAQMLEKSNNNLALALAYYHDGPNSATARMFAQTGDLKSLTPEGQKYVPDVLKKYQDIRELVGTEGMGTEQVAQLRERGDAVSNGVVAEAVERTGGETNKLLSRIETALLQLAQVGVPTGQLAYAGAGPDQVSQQIVAFTR